MPRSIVARNWQRRLAADRARPLTALDVHYLDSGPGVYAAWLIDRSILRHAGLRAQPPLPIYVGKAVTGNGIPGRMFLHAHVPMLELIDLLALQGLALSPFAARRPRRADEPYRSDLDPLSERASEQALAWQHDHLRWSLLYCDRVQAEATELRAIESWSPLLNIRGLPRYPPPQMRAAGPSPRAQSQWLWHMSWAGLLFGDRRGSLNRAERDIWQLDERDAEYRADADGFPVPPGRKDASSRDAVRVSDLPDADELRQLFYDAADDAPQSVRHALGRDGLDDDNLDMWWAAHVAAPLLPQPCDIHKAIASSLQMTPAAARPGPPRLPTAARRDELWRLTTLLPRYRH